MSGNTSDFLLEIGVEEMPARFLDPALAEMKELAISALAEQRLGFKQVKTCGTPRRLTLFVEGLAKSQESLEIEIKGPAAKVAFKPDGTPTKAAEGFAKSHGVSVSDLVKKPVGQVDYMFATKVEAGRQAMEVLSGIVPALIAGLHFPKPMRWGNLEVRFARPIRWIVSLFGSEIVDFLFAGQKTGRITFGHRFLNQEPVKLANPSEYFEKMRGAHVLVDQHERRETIRRQVLELAASAGGTIEKDEDLLNEVNNLVEYPTALIGEFNPEYLKLPKEVLVTLMREHQRYFPVAGPDGGLLSKFIAVRNGATNHLDIVRAGNEKVLRARLADADFFFQEDLKTPLVEKTASLKKIVFQESLGSIYDKVVRVSALADYLAGAMGAGVREKKHALRAAYLAKADLVTNMVYEFPELQGIMGREYAKRSGEEQCVAAAIFEHYQPRFAGDDLPGSVPGKILSIADKMDNIVGCFAIGIQPSGSQDPYALRRQALGICNILLEGGIKLSLERLIANTYSGYEGKVQLKLSLAKVTEEVTEFFKQRLRGILEDRGFSYDTVEAVLASGYDDFSDAFLRAQALAGFRTNPAFGDLLTAFIRANNLSKKITSNQVEPSRLEDDSEKELFNRLSNVRKKAGAYLVTQDYHSLLAAIATLQEPVDRFFNAVMVMVEDKHVRENRLALLQSLVALVKKVADLSKIVVESK
ncbi:MAG: Glycine--tRNA ligase beta subunit [Pelotomaculum sp. PtaU1.Bin035]|nr:MAG: Glycine--tRNA ligase beta subunit [Pelotomaculum sp. PtaU1.Bin035]